MESTLKVNREESVPCHLKLHVEVPEEQVDEVFNKFERDCMNKAKVPGFRPGKVPRNMIRKQYGKQIQEQATEKLIQDKVQEALKQEGLTPESQPILEDKKNISAERGRPFSFTFEFDVEPEFELPDYRNIAVPDEGEKVDDSQVEEMIGEVLQGRRSYETVERPAELEDLLKADYQAKLDEEKMAEYPESAKFILQNENGWLALRDPEILPGIKESLLGVQAGDTCEITVEFPDDFFESSLAGQSLQYVVDVKEVQGAVTPELTDETAKELGAESAEDVRNKVRGNLEQRADQERKGRQRQEIVNSLLDEVEMTIPPHSLAQETSELYMQMNQRDSGGQGGEAGEGGDEKSEDEKQQEADRAARHRLKRSYILRKIADTENIKVEQNEMQSTIESLSRYHQTSAQDLMQRLQESGRIVDLLDDIRANKTLEHLRGTLTGEVTPKAEQTAETEEQNKAASGSEDDSGENN